jgi:hypothetical protein
VNAGRGGDEDIRTSEEESLLANTILLMLSNGRTAYISDDVSDDNPTYQVTGSPPKHGCGEIAIVNGFLELMQKYGALILWRVPAAVRMWGIGALPAA